MALIYSPYHRRYIKKFTSQIGPIHGAHTQPFASPLAAGGDLVSYGFPSSAEVGKEAPWNCDVHNVGTDGVIAFGIVNNSGNPGNIVVKWDGKDITLEPGYYWRVQTVNPVPNCHHLVTSGKVVFQAEGNYTVRLWGMHQEGGAWFYDEEAVLTVSVKTGTAPPEQWPVTKTVKIFSNYPLKSEWFETWKETARTLNGVDMSVLLGGKVTYRITYTEGDAGFARLISLYLNNGNLIPSGEAATLTRGQSMEATVDITGLITGANTVKVGYETWLGKWAELTFDVTVTLGYSKEPKYDPGVEEPIPWLKYAAIGTAAVVVIYGIKSLTSRQGPIVVIERAEPRRKEET